MGALDESQMQPQDEFALFYSGAIDPRRRLLDSSFLGKALSTEQLAHWLESLSAKDQLVVLDANHADEMQDELRRLLKPDQRSGDLDKRQRLFIARKGPDPHRKRGDLHSPLQ